MDDVDDMILVAEIADTDSFTQPAAGRCILIVGEFAPKSPRRKLQ
ncbi:hypothetical protein [Mesorhizobium sp. SARCC-RB16n]|nr:hypothetical protein [Mesorhizobium sp. SARCC-RB16n]